MDTILILVTSLSLLALSALIAFKSGFVRWLFFRVYAFVKGDELVGPSLVHNPPVNSPYQRWLERVGTDLPLHEGPVLHDIGHIALKPWPDIGAGIEGLYLHFADYQMLDAWVVEIPPHGKTVGQRYLYEKGIYILRGTGHTSLQLEGKPERKITWSTGDLFSIPLNVCHQHHNSGDQPTRMLMVTSFPLMLNLIGDEDFIFNNPGVFDGRYNAESDYLEAIGELARLERSANFVKDIRNTPARKNDFRGKGNQSIRWQMAGNSMLSMHISEMPPRMIKKAHRISSNAFVLVLTGSGCTVLWREGLYGKRVRIDWKPGTLFVPPVFWYQQHLNYGSEPARYLAINVPGFVRNIGLHLEDQLEVDLPEVKAEWKQELENTPSKQS